MAVKDISALVQALNDDKLVLFIGHDFEAQNSGLPTLSALTDRLNQHGAWEACRLCGSSGACQRPGACILRFREAASRLVQLHNGRVQPLIELLSGALSDPQPSPLLEMIVRLPFRMIITTAYDERLEVALRSVKRGMHSIATGDQITARTIRDAQVLHLYGLIDQPDSLLLTSQDFLTAHKREGRQRLDRIVAGLLPGHVFLCLGVDFNDEYVQQLYLEDQDRQQSQFPWPYQLESDSAGNSSAGIKSVILPYTAAELMGELRQKARRRRATLPPPPKPDRPYKFLDAFEANDRAIFYGREEDSQKVVERVMAGRLMILIAKSGQGKSSLLRAGVIPALEAEGFTIASIRLESEPNAALAQGLTALGLQPEAAPAVAAGAQLERQLLIIDQAEELFTVIKETKARNEFAETLRNLRDSHPTLHVLLSLRVEYQGQLETLLGGPEWMTNRYTLGPLAPDDARLAIVKPAELFDFKVELSLADAILGYLEPEEYDPVQLQIICHELYQDMIKAGSRALTYARYEELGRAEEILTTFMDRVLEQLGDPGLRENARAVMKSLVTANRTKVARSPEEIAKFVAFAGLTLSDVQELLLSLQNRRLVRALNSGRFELSHDILALKVFKWMDEADLKRLNAATALQITMDRYREFGHLMEAENQVAVHQAAPALDLNGQELAMLLMSSIATNQRDLAGFWLDQVMASPEPVGENLCRELSNAAEKYPQRLGEIVTRAQILSNCLKSGDDKKPLKDEILDTLINYFSIGELRLLVFSLGYDHMQLDASRKDAYAEGLIAIFERTTALDSLVAKVIDERPHASLARFSLIPPANSERERLLDYLDKNFTSSEIQELVAFLQLDSDIGGNTRDNLRYMLLIETTERRLGLDALWVAIGHFHSNPIEDYLERLAKVLEQRFDEDQLRDLCFDLGANYEFYGSKQPQIISGLIQDFFLGKEPLQELPVAALFPERIGLLRFETRLRRLLIERLSEDEFDSVCLYLNIDPENFGGLATKAKLRELISYVSRREALSRLIYVLFHKIPDLENEIWKETLPLVKQRGTSLAVFKMALGDWTSDFKVKTHSKLLNSRESILTWLEHVSAHSLELSEIEERLRLEGKDTFLEVLQSYWNDEEINDLCFSLGVNYENLDPPLLTKISGLFDHLGRRGRLHDLLLIMVKERPYLAES
jgi:hypothetical protein